MVPRREVNTPPQGTAEEEKTGRKEGSKEGGLRELYPAKNGSCIVFGRKKQLNHLLFSLFLLQAGESIRLMGFSLRCGCTLGGGHAALSLTHACWQGVVPLRQVVWNALAADGGGTVQHVARVAFELHQGAHGEVVAETLAESWLWDGAALGGACPGNGCGGAGQDGERSTIERYRFSFIFLQSLGLP